MAVSPLEPYVPWLVVEWQTEAPESAFLEREGSLLFVDLSGFTAMSERLARLGKAGAEEVVDVIGSTFARLLTVVGETDGRFLKFGGDAVLLFFHGAGHAARAAYAGASMRRALRSLNPIRTAAGPVRLQMSAGIHSGVFHLFLAGSSHRELVITGPAATRTVQMESAATAGEVLLSETTAELLGPRFLGTEKEGGRLLARTPPLPRAPAPIQPARGLPCEPFVPSEIRTHILGGGHDPEHRLVTISFIHFGGIDEMIARHGPASVATALQDLFTAVQERFDANGITFLGTDIDKDGGKIFLCAGAPRASEDDEERVLTALREVIASPGPLALRAGVNRGRVFCGAVGPPVWRTYTVMGDATNTAARVMSRARPGEILATASVLDNAGVQFAREELPPFTAKGKAKPLIAYRVGEPLAPRAQREAARPLVGRERELAALLGAARAGAPRVIDVLGERGIGKSRLLAELRARAGLRTFSVVTPRQESAQPYAPFRAVLQDALELGNAADAGTLLARVEAIAPELLPWVPLIAIPLGIDVPMTAEVERTDEAFRAARLQRSVSEVMRAAVPEPALFVFDDAHWMDDASAALLRALVRDIAGTRWCVVTARRPEERGFIPEPGTAETLTVEALPDDDATELVRTIAAEVLRPHDIDALVARAGGNPLFVEELAEHAREQGSVEDLPESVDALVTARIDTLAPADRLVLRHAAVLGMTVEPDLLSSVLREAGVTAGRGTLRRLEGFLVPDDGTLRFRHALLRDTAYEGLPYRRRREIHRLVGTILEQQSAHPEERAEALSWHFYTAADYPKAWRYARLAGERSADRFAHVDATRFFRIAIDAARRLGDQVPPEELAHTWEALAMSCDPASLFGDAVEAFRAARRLAPEDPETRARLLFRTGQMEERLARYGQALRWYTRGLRALDGTPTEPALVKWRNRLLLGSAYVRMRRGQFHEAIHLAQRIASEAAAGGDEPGLAHAYVCLHLAYMSIGSPERARYRELPVRVYERIGDMRALASFLNVLGGEAYFEGRWEDAAAHYRRSAEVARRAGDVVAEGEATNNLAEILSDQGRLEEAERLFRQARAAWVPAGYRIGIAVATGNLGRAAARAARSEEAEQLLQEALSEFRAIGAQDFVLQTEARLAEAAAAAKEPRLAIERADALLARTGGAPGTQPLEAIAHRARAEALLQSGEEDEARAALELSIARARAAGAEFDLALALMLWSEREQALGPAPNGAAEELGELLGRLGVLRAPVT